MMLIIKYGKLSEEARMQYYLDVEALQKDNNIGRSR